MSGHGRRYEPWVRRRSRSRTNRPPVLDRRWRRRRFPLRQESRAYTLAPALALAPVKQAPEWVLAVVPAKPGLAWALVALPGKLGLAWALVALPGKLGLAWALVVALGKPGLAWALVVAPAKPGLALVLAVVPGKREPAWVWGLVTPGPVSGLDRPCRKLSLSQMGFRFPKQRSHLCTRISGLAKNLIGPSGSRFRIEIAAEHHHQIYKFANISSAGDSI